MQRQTVISKSVSSSVFLTQSMKFNSMDPVFVILYNFIHGKSFELTLKEIFFSFSIHKQCEWSFIKWNYVFNLKVESFFSPTLDLDCLACVDNVEGKVGDSLKLNNEDKCFTCDFSDEGIVLFVLTMFTRRCSFHFCFTVNLLIYVWCWNISIN